VSVGVTSYKSFIIKPLAAAALTDPTARHGEALPLVVNIEPFLAFDDMPAQL